MKASFISTTAILFLISGCTTIHFDNGPAPSENVQVSKWHHNFAFALYEGSPPVNLKKECNDSEWESVKTELSFFKGFSGGVTNGAIGAALLSSSGGAAASFPLWYPKSVEISCG